MSPPRVTRSIACGDVDEHLVTDVVPTGVVDRLESVEVDEQQTHGRVGPTRERELHVAHERVAVQQSGERIRRRFAGESFLEVAACGDVGLQGDHVRRPVFVRREQRGARHDPDHRAVGSHHAELGDRVEPADLLGGRLDAAVEILRVHTRPRVGADQGLARALHELRAGRVDVEDQAVEIDEGNAQRRVLERGPEPLFGFPVRALGPLALFDVAGGDDDTATFDVGTEVLPDALERPVAAVRRFEPQLDRLHRSPAPREDLPQRFGRHRRVVGMQERERAAGRRVARVVAQQSARLLARFPVPVRVEHRDDVRRVVDDRAQPRFAGLERAPRLELGRYVFEGAVEVLHRPGGVVHRRRLHACVEHGAVLADEPAHRVDLGRTLGEPLSVADERRPIVLVHELVERACQEFLAAVADELREREVGVDPFAPGIRLHLRHRRVLEHQPERPLLLVALGEVTEVEHEAGDIRIVGHVRGDDLEQPPPTLGRAHPDLGGLLHARPRQRSAQRFQRFGCFVGVQQIERVHADQLLGVVADAARRFRADVRDRSRPVGDDDELGRVVHDRPEPRRVRQGVAMCVGAFGHVLHHRDREPVGNGFHAALIRAHHAVDLVLVLVCGSGAARERGLERAHRGLRLIRRQRVSDAARREPRTVEPVPAEEAALVVEQEHHPARASHQGPHERIRMPPEISHLSCIGRITDPVNGDRFAAFDEARWGRSGGPRPLGARSDAVSTSSRADSGAGP